MRLRPNELLRRSQKVAAHCQLCFRERATLRVSGEDGSVYRIGPHCLERLRVIAQEAGVDTVEARAL